MQKSTRKCHYFSNNFILKSWKPQLISPQRITQSYKWSWTIMNSISALRRSHDTHVKFIVHHRSHIDLSCIPNMFSRFSPYVSSITQIFMYLPTTEQRMASTQTPSDNWTVIQKHGKENGLIKNSGLPEFPHAIT